MRVPLNRNVIGARFKWQRVVLLALFVLAAFSVVIFGLRSYRSFLLLHSAYKLGDQDLGSVRRRFYQQPERASRLIGSSCCAGIYDPAKLRAAHDREELANTEPR